MRYSIMIRCIGEKTPKGFFAFLDLLKETPFSGVNLAFNETPFLFDADFPGAEFKKELFSYGFTLRYAHGPMIYPGLFGRTDFREISERLLKGLDIAADLGITDYTIHPGSAVNEDYEYLRGESIEKNVAFLRPFVKRGKELGVRVAFENGINQPWDDPRIPLKTIMPDFDELIGIVDLLRAEFGDDSCGICFDTGHAHIAGLEPLTELKKIGNRLFMTHIHDNDGGKDDHLPVGEGSFDWAHFREGIDAIGFDDELSLELYYEDEIWQNRPEAYFRRLHEGLIEI